MPEVQWYASKDKGETWEEVAGDYPEIREQLPEGESLHNPINNSWIKWERRHA